MTDIAIRVEVEAQPLLQELEMLRERDVPESRRCAVERVTREGLRRIIAHNPVDTGRARSAWVTALKQAGGTPPAGWRGPDPDSDAIAEGGEKGTYDFQNGRERTEAQATNAVSYVVYLERGTGKMEPFHMARKSLSEIRGPLLRAAFAECLSRMRSS